MSQIYFRKAVIKSYLPLIENSYAANFVLFIKYYSIAKQKIDLKEYFIKIINSFLIMIKIIFYFVF